MAFGIVKDPMNTQAELLEISSQTVLVGDMLEIISGTTESWVVTTSGTEWWTEKAIAIESATSSDTEVNCVLVHPLQLVEVEVANNSSTAHNGQRMVLTDKNTVNNTGSNATGNDAIFRQHSTVGVAADKKVVGYFSTGSGLDEPSAS